MATIECCNQKQKVDEILAVLGKTGIDKLLHLNSCINCGTKIVIVKSLDLWGNPKQDKRLKSARAKQLLDDSVVLYRSDKLNEGNEKTSWYLNYNEFGRKKRCYSNISTLKIGMFEPDNLGLDATKIKLPTGV